jgi:crotonobetainyl-CoA:carnitine CoA-transferase CaiB-like acyl-CoA transferase
LSDTPPCAGVRVIEIGESASAAVAGMVLADFGAEVLLVEPPSGTRLRHAPAFPMWSRGKRCLPLDLSTSAGQDDMHELGADADVMITALAPRTADELGVDGASMTARHPQLVHCEITGFGRGHPSSDVAGYEGVVAAAAGRAYELGVLFDGVRPAFPAVPVATHGAAMLALEGTFAALLEREQTGRGQRIETSLLRALSVFDLGSWAPGADRALRPFDAPMLIYTVARTRDGVWLQFSQNGTALFRAFLRALGLEHLLDDPRFRSAPNIADPDDVRALRRILLDRVHERTWDEWQSVFAGDPDVSAEPFARPGNALRHPQLLHTGDVVEMDDAVLGRTRQLGPLVTIAARPGATGAARTDASSHLLQGVTVLELSTWIATPMATALLAELGARIVKIEPLDGDPMRRYGPMGLKCVQGKESIALDLKTDEGRGIVHRLAEHADALVHNYRPGVPERLGIDDSTLRALNPSLIHLYAASYGSTGPMSMRPAFHVTAGAVCGGALAQSGGDGAPGPAVELSDEELVWWSQRLIRCNEANPDFNAALVVAVAVTMALYARARTGEGQTVETRMMAANAYALSEHFIDYPGRPPRLLPDAGVHGLHALYRLYPTFHGWVFVAAVDDRDFARLCAAIGSDALARDPRFSTPSARRQHDDELARALEAALATRDATTLERELTAAGVACVRSYPGSHAAYVFDSPWSRELGLVEDACATGFGPYPRYGRVVRTERDVGPLGPADAVGAQTRSILAELGYTDDEVEALRAAAVVGTPD